ncbi:MAG: septum formation protein Maf [Candidatus Rokubacteria bacterium]|nr:septum formation protein Maf [Candidatus Rokubacteria bacterium]MBI3108719.1 septum formation protein Maf [Candidatus Rokubacteria bacterium]
MILASASPRRQELLARLGILFTVRPSHLPEVPPPEAAPADAVVALALAKARAVALALPAPGGVVLGADTEVVIEGELLGKPEDAADAVRILRRLRGRVHEVVTGLALVEAPPGGREETASVTTRVRMADYADAAIEAYVATGEPFDKAGAYGVQGLGGRLVAEVDGCFTNVVGLPVSTTRRLLRAWGLLP